MCLSVDNGVITDDDVDNCSRGLPEGNEHCAKQSILILTVALENHRRDN